MRVDRAAMHRRAQKAEGRLEAGLFTLRMWRKFCSRDGRHSLLNVVLDDIEKQMVKKEPK